MKTLTWLKGGLKAGKLDLPADYDPKAPNYKTSLSKDEKKATKQISNAAEAEAYFKELKGLASELMSAEEKLNMAKEAFEKVLKDKDRKKEDKELESKAQAMLKSTNKAIADLQKTWGRLWQGAGALLKLSPNTKTEQIVRDGAAGVAKLGRQKGLPKDRIKNDLKDIKNKLYNK